MHVVFCTHCLHAFCCTHCLHAFCCMLYIFGYASVHHDYVNMCISYMSNACRYCLNTSDTCQTHVGMCMNTLDTSQTHMGNKYVSGRCRPHVHWLYIGWWYMDMEKKHHFNNSSICVLACSLLLKAISECFMKLMTSLLQLRSSQI